ncbi:MAG: tRNA pseudouridine(38-40) synthase TruA [Pirellulales bacterium]
MRWFKLTLAYDGTNYCGWQVQPGRITLQETLEAALTSITGQPIRVTASGRTDAGVHALGQVVGFASETHLEPAVLQKALNGTLPLDMAVVSAEIAHQGFHATHDAKRKTYRYTIDDGPVRDVFARHYAWQHRSPLDVEAMRRAATTLVGTHDFSSFESHGSPRENSVRTVYSLSIERLPAPATTRIILEIEGNGFLYNMVRAIVGTLVDVGRGAESEAWPGEVLAARDRSAAGQTAPAHGLCLVRANY